MTTYYHVLSYPTAQGDRIVTEIFNPIPGQILKSFEVPEPSIPFNPLTILTDGRVEELKRLKAETYQQAVNYLKQLGS